MGSKYEQINNLIEQIGWGPYNYTCFIVCGMNFSSIMLWGSCISIAIKVAGDDWSLSGYEEGLLGTSHTFGIFIGSYFWGYQSNYKGRLKSLKIIDMLSIFFSALFVLSLNYPMLIISIFFQGFCNGGAVVASVTLYSETIPQNKSWTMVLLSGFMVCGGCIAYAMALFISIGGYYQIALWRWVGAVAFILQIAFWAATYLIEESPKFLIRTSSDKETCQVLEKIAKRNHKEIDIHIDINVGSATINSEDLDQKHVPGKLKELFDERNFRKTMLFTTSMFLGDMSYSALVSFMPILLNKIGTKITNSTELYGTILAQVFLGIPGTLISSYLVTTVLKKKWTTSISFLLASLCVFIFLISTKYWMVLLSTSFIYFFNFMGYASIMAIIPESYPVNVRSIGTGWVNAWCKFGGVISPVAVGILFDLEGGITLSVLLISLCFAAVGVISAFFTEPNAKEIEEEPLWGNNFG